MWSFRHIGELFNVFLIIALLPGSKGSNEAWLGLHVRCKQARGTCGRRRGRVSAPARVCTCPASVQPEPPSPCTPPRNWLGPLLICRQPTRFQPHLCLVVERSPHP